MARSVLSILSFLFVSSSLVSANVINLPRAPSVTTVLSTYTITGQVVPTSAVLGSCPSINGEQYTTANGTFLIQCNADYSGRNTPGPNGMIVADFQTCLNTCAANSQCVTIAYRWKARRCWMHKAVTPLVATSGAWSALLISGPSPLISTSKSSTGTTSSTSSSSLSSTSSTSQSAASTFATSSSSSSAPSAAASSSSSGSSAPSAAASSSSSSSSGPSAPSAAASSSSSSSSAAPSAAVSSSAPSAAASSSSSSGSAAPSAVASSSTPSDPPAAASSSSSSAPSAAASSSSSAVPSAAASSSSSSAPAAASSSSSSSSAAPSATASSSAPSAAVSSSPSSSSSSAPSAAASSSSPSSSSSSVPSAAASSSSPSSSSSSSAAASSSSAAASSTSSSPSSTSSVAASSSTSSPSSSAASSSTSSAPTSTATLCPADDAQTYENDQGAVYEIHCGTVFDGNWLDYGAAPDFDTCFATCLKGTIADCVAVTYISSHDDYDQHCFFQSATVTEGATPIPLGAYGTNSAVLVSAPQCSSLSCVDNSGDAQFCAAGSDIFFTSCETAYETDPISASNFQTLGECANACGTDESGDCDGVVFFADQYRIPGSATLPSMNCFPFSIGNNAVTGADADGGSSALIVNIPHLRLDYTQSGR